MKIIHVLPTLVVGGAESNTINTIVELSNIGHKIILVVNYAYRTDLYFKLLQNNIEIISLKQSPFITGNIGGCYNALTKKINGLFDELFIFYKLKRILVTHNADIVHLHLESCRYFKKFIPGKYVYTCHSDFSRYAKIFGKRWLHRYNRLSMHGMITIALNQGMLVDLRRHVPDNQLVKIPNWIDIREFKKQTMSKEVLCESLNLDNDSILIGQIGRLDPVKNHKKSINILKQMIENRGKNYYLLIIGTGSEDYLRYLKRICSELGVMENVVFMGYRSDVGRIISALDYALLPSFNEGFSITSLELQAHNVRSVFSEAIPEEVVCNENCFRLSVDENDSLWVETLLGEHKSRYRKDIMKFDKQSVIGSIEKLYEKIMTIEA